LGKFFGKLENIPIYEKKISGKILGNWDNVLNL
jgi:hypothetical protein